MTRYFDKAKGVEVRAGFDDIAAANVVELDDANPFFSPVPDGQQLIYSDGVPAGLEAVSPISLPDAKAAIRQAINSAADAAMAPVSAKYPRSEIDSWQIQTAEAAAFTADNNASTPFIDGLMAHRVGVTKSDLANKITTNKAAYTAIAADVFGQRQALDDQVEVATTIAELDAIVVSIAVPG